MDVSAPRGQWWRLARTRVRNADRSSYADEIRRVGFITVWVRVGVVLSAAVLLLVGPESTRQYPLLAWGTVAVALCYSLLVVRHASWELEDGVPAGAITALDAVLASAIVASTGAARSPGVAILFLVIIAAATRLSFLATIGLSLGIGGCYLLTALVISAADTGLQERLLAGVWWAVYLMMTGVLGSGLILLNEYAERARGTARSEAIAERIVANEERDLRGRLMAAHEAQETGLRVILHEFRTPIASLRALAHDLDRTEADTSPAGPEERVRLLIAHTEHLSAMMDALADVAASRRPTFSTGHRQLLDVRELVLTAADAASLSWDKLRITVSPPNARVRLDAQLVRRIATNLLENASRQGRNQPVSVVATVSEHTLVLDIADRGPGVVLERIPELTAKFVQAGHDQGTAGLGLWIVDQIVKSLHGTVRFDNAPGGGLAVRVELPV